MFRSLPFDCEFMPNRQCAHRLGTVVESRLEKTELFVEKPL